MKHVYNGKFHVQNRNGFLFKQASISSKIIVLRRKSSRARLCVYAQNHAKEFLFFFDNNFETKTQRARNDERKGRVCRIWIDESKKKEHNIREAV